MKKKIRMTHQRELILQELCKCTSHPSADELHLRVKKKLPRISLATVYRNLEMLAEAGAITKIEITGRQKRFDWELQQHNHIYCVQCHRVDNILLKPGIEILRPEDDQGYAITGCRIEFTGLCPACQKKIQHELGGTGMGDKKCVPGSLNDLQRKVLKVLAGIKGACGSKEVAASSGMDAKAVSTQLTALKKKGYVDSPARCKYEITREGKKAIA
ncbi:MAG TPA: Fur family transcriptional regulator [Desulfobulbaceae bacterium]|nr:Fur family transcriptional regulator [Desulfobulbaceae bacterium]